MMASWAKIPAIQPILHPASGQRYYRECEHQEAMKWLSQLSVDLGSRIWLNSKASLAEQSQWMVGATERSVSMSATTEPRQDIKVNAQIKLPT